MPINFENIEQHVCPPTVREPVRAYIKQLGSAFLLREIWKPLGLPRMVVHRELQRMIKAGLLVRHKIPAQEVTFGRWDKVRMFYLYTPVELAE